MKKLSLIAAALVFASSGALAQVSDNFNVNVTLTTSCSVLTAAGSLDFTYTAFQGTNATAGSTTVFQCSRGLIPTFVFDSGAGKAASAAAASGITGAGIVAGLRYTLTGTTTKTDGTAATAAAAGTADQYSVAIDGVIASGQAGDGALSATQARTLTITY